MHDNCLFIAPMSTWIWERNKEGFPKGTEVFTQRPKNQLKLSEERGRMIKQYVHMPGVKTLSEPKEKPAGKGDWGMKLSSAFQGTGQGGTEERHTRWTWGQ